ncbi:hypothetical protein PWT90_03777 [Aphanocladium album]|nr:hypothetical protein PWT90_03777 [Aphanocladium album]
MEEANAKGFAVCPTNTQWYRCSNGFVGCCSVDPCNLSICPGELEANIPTTLSSLLSLIMSSNRTQPPISATVSTGDANSTDAPDSASSTSSDRASPSSSSPPPPSRTTPSKTDSGVTHTIPNDSTVTVTRHTTITRELPTTTTDSGLSFTTKAADSSTASSTEAQQPTQTPAENGTSIDQPGTGVNTGAVVGIAVGGVFAAALLLGLFYLWRSRRNRALKQVENGSEPAFLDKSGLHDNIFGRRPESAILPRHPTPHQASENSQGYGYDPFAPFGGRADQPASTSPPPLPNTFEMDGRGIQVAELPGTAVTTPDGTAIDAERQENQSVGAVKQRPSSDPRATLNHLPRENGRPTYINQWNQYKTLAGETDTR